VGSHAALLAFSDLRSMAGLAPILLSRLQLSIEISKIGTGKKRQTAEAQAIARQLPSAVPTND
jgi:stage V sporulation protein SpoVS